MKQTLSYFCFLLVFAAGVTSNSAQFSSDSRKNTENNDWLQGDGEALQLILRGLVLRADGTMEQAPSILAELNATSDKKSIASVLNGNSFEISLPLYPSKWDGIQIQVASADGTQVATNSAGEFEMPLLKDERLDSGTAWTDSFALGGSWWDLAEKDLQDIYTIELYQCRTQRVLVVDENEKPVPNLKFNLHVEGAGVFDKSMIQTDAQGLADLEWFPELENPEWWVELPPCE